VNARLGAGILLCATLAWTASTSSRAQEGESHPLPGDDQCIICHAELDDELAWPVEHFVTDVHLAAGLSCHGGDPTAADGEDAMDPKRGFLDSPDPLEMPKFCDRCHGDAAYMKGFNPGLPIDQLAKYRTSVHGHKNAGGDRKAAQCASCHPAHQVKAADDPTSSVHAFNIPQTCGHCHADADYMAGYGIPTDQLAGYTSSVHGQALLERHDVGAPACNDCHGNHSASPPLTSSIANVCGNCHAFNAELFAQSPHKAAYEENDFPACETCHGQHEIRKLTAANLGEGDESICLDCHDADDGTTAVTVANNMKRQLDSLTRVYEVADSLLHSAERKGMYTEEEQYALKDARQAAIQAHTLIHSFSDSVVGTRVDSGLKVVAAVRVGAEEKLAESAFRRWGLLVSTLVISFVVLMLYLKIRQIERRKPTT
jgi:hypothetical protein